MIPYNGRNTLALKQLCRGAPLDECTTAVTCSAFESHLSWLGHRDDSPQGDDSGRRSGSRVSTLETWCTGRSRVWAEKCPAWLPAAPVRKTCHGPLWQLRLSKFAVELLAECHPVCPPPTLLSGQVTTASSLGNWQVFQIYQDCRQWSLWQPWGWGQISSSDGGIFVEALKPGSMDSCHDGDTQPNYFWSHLSTLGNSRNI